MALLQKPRVVIAGGGVLGVSTAYYLARDHGVGAVVVDRVGIAAAASGRAGGFLAKDWNDGSATEALTRRSFELHAELGVELQGTDYRRLKCAAVAIDSSQPSNMKLKNVEWAEGLGSRPMGDEATIAQVHPRKLCEAMMAAATELAGAELRVGAASGFRKSGEVVTGLEVDGEVIEADAVVVAMGPWSDSLRSSNWGVSGFPEIVGTKYHAVLLQNDERVLNEAVFFQGMGDPEVYPRPDGEVYVTGFPDPPAVVTDLPGETAVVAEVCDRLESTVKTASSELQRAKRTGAQACHLPSAPDGLPVIGQLAKGGYVATGHGCWGVLLAPATGKALADLIVTGRSDLDLAPFAPSRFS